MIMITRYMNLFKFIKDMPKLKDSIVIFPHDIEEQFSYLTTIQSKQIKEQMKRLNIKFIIEKERKYEGTRKTI